MLPRIPKRFVALVFGVLALYVMATAGKSAAQQRQQPRQNQQQQRPTQQQIQQAQRQAQQLRQQVQQQQQQMAQYIQQLQRNQAMRNQQMAQAARIAQQQQGQRPGQGQGQPQLRDVTTTYEFVVADEGVVRTMTLLAPELDDKGRPKKLNAEETKIAKGDSDAERKFTGWKASMEDLQAGDEVVVTLARHRPEAKGTAKKKADDDDEDTPKMKGKAKAEDGEEKPKEKKAKAKDADDEEKPKAKEKEEGDEKPKAKGKEKEGDEDAKEVKKIDQSMWRPVGKLMGIVSEVDASGSRRMVIRITQKQMVAPGQGGGGAGRGGQAGGARGANQNNIAIDPATMQATLVVITKRGTGMESPGGGGAGFGGFGK